MKAVIEQLNEVKEKINISSWKKGILPVAAVAVVLCGILWLFLANTKGRSQTQPQVINQLTMEKIIHVSDLSTFEAVYNGIAKKSNEENPENADYYVSYGARVKAGIDFEKIGITIDNEEKVIRVKLPQVKITNINVDIASLDYIFENDAANTSTVSEQAYKLCIEDVRNESSREEAILELAKQNACNVIEALIMPLVEQLDAGYQLKIE